MKHNKEPGACSRADRGRQLRKIGSRRSQAPGIMRFFFLTDPKGECANFSTVQISVSPKNQLSYWTRIRPRAKGSHYKDTVDGGSCLETFLFIICLIASLLSFKKFILVHVVMQSGSRACIAWHGMALGALALRNRCWQTHLRVLANLGSFHSYAILSDILADWLLLQKDQDIRWENKTLIFLRFYVHVTGLANGY